MTLPMTFDHRRFARQAMAISFLFHASILGLFIFNFQSQQIPAQPLVVFLGSILQRSDVANAFAPQQTDTQVADEMIATMQRKLQSSTGRLTAVPANTTSKPALSAKPIDHPKKDIKNFSEFLPLENIKQDTQPERPTEPTIAPRQPLKLNPDDPH